MGARGPSPGTGGRPRKPLLDKINDGNPGKRPLTVMEFDNAADLTGADMLQHGDLNNNSQSLRTAVPRIVA